MSLSRQVVAHDGDPARDSRLRLRPLERRDRLGGRTWTNRFPDTGEMVELGGSWFAPEHEAAPRELARYGLDVRTHRLSLQPDALAGAAQWIESQRTRWERLFDVVGDYLEERR